MFFLTVLLNFFQFRINLNILYIFKSLLYFLFYHTLEYLVILTHLEYLFQRLYQTYKAWTLASSFNISLIFLFHFKLGVRVRGDIMITLSHISHIRWDGNGHRLWDHREGHRKFWKDDVITIQLIYIGLETNT